MEANLFRLLVAELACVLEPGPAKHGVAEQANDPDCIDGVRPPMRPHVRVGARLEKASMPAVAGNAEPLYVFTLHPVQHGRYLFIRPARHNGPHRGDSLLFTSDYRPTNPPRPPAWAMKLRKELSGVRVARVLGHWPALQVALTFNRRTISGYSHLLVDMRRGLSFGTDLPADFGVQPEWPDASTVLEGLRTGSELWKDHPQLSPPLRKHLSALQKTDESAARELYQRVAAGRHCNVCVPQQADAPPTLFPRPGTVCESFDSVLAAHRQYGERVLFGLLTGDDGEEQASRRREGKRLKKNLARLSADEERLERMCARAAQAELLKSVLATRGEEKLPHIDVPGADGAAVRVELDRRLSVGENMQRIFSRAAKGRRGLAMVAARRQHVQQELDALEQGRASEEGAAGVQAPAKRAHRAAEVPKKWRGLAVKRFVTSGGFVCARGKNAKANHELLSRAASPFDLWFHAKDVAGAHLILKLDHPTQEVDEVSLAEAAILAGLASGCCGEAGAAGVRCEVLCARVREVRKIKGSAHGLVRVENPERVLFVELDPSLEERLVLER